MLTNDDGVETQTAVKMVFLSSDAYRYCLTQCLSTEVEEVMGLLIGYIDEAKGHCHITNNLPLKRLDKRKDRVEIGTEQLASSFGIVDELNEARKAATPAGQPTVQVVGWYHSHPHITVFPSDVDIATHHQYQSTMSEYWIGLIFGVFNYDDSAGANRLQLVAFQSMSNDRRRKTVSARDLVHETVPIIVEPRQEPHADPWALRRLSTLIDLLWDEEREAYSFNEAEAGSIGQFHNACVYSKAICKLLTFLAAPLIDVAK